jgi:hypothetical protein
VRVLCPVIASSAHNVFALHPEIAQRGTIGWQFVRHDCGWSEALCLEHFPHQFQCGPLVSSGLDQEIQNLPFTIYGAPQIHIPAIARYEYLIEMPACVCAWMRSSELSGVGKAKFYRLAADGFIGDIDATLGQQILDHPENSEEIGNTARRHTG